MVGWVTSLGFGMEAAVARPLYRVFLPPCGICRRSDHPLFQPLATPTPSPSIWDINLADDGGCSELGLFFCGGRGPCTRAFCSGQVPRRVHAKTLNPRPRDPTPLSSPPAQGPGRLVQGDAAGEAGAHNLKSFAKLGCTQEGSYKLNF